MKKTFACLLAHGASHFTTKQRLRVHRPQLTISAPAATTGNSDVNREHSTSAHSRLLGASDVSSLHKLSPYIVHQAVGLHVYMSEDSDRCGKSIGIERALAYYWRETDC